VRWGRTLNVRPSPRILPWPGWPDTPDPLGTVPFNLLDDVSESWIQCDGCCQWFQVHKEVVTAYRKPQNMAFLCRYLTGVACKGDFRHSGEAAAQARLPEPRLHAVKRCCEEAEVDAQSLGQKKVGVRKR